MLSIRKSESKHYVPEKHSSDENTKVGGKRGGLHDIRQSRLLL
jgi:hypothetical protein